MSLLVPCPNCGLREFTEFSYGGETNPRPDPGAPPEQLADYLFVRRNAAGPQHALPAQREPWLGSWLGSGDHSISLLRT